MKDLWGDVELAAGEETQFALGDLVLRVRRQPEEIWVHGTHEPSGAPATADWMRWAVGAGDRIELRPSLPDRPVVVSPEQPFHLPPHAEARVFARAPLFAGLHSIDSDGLSTCLLCEPAAVLSDTWWGSFTDGELAYWLTTRARRSAPPDIFEPHVVVCPLMLSNRADDPLPIDRFAVRVAHLTLFARGDALVTDEVLVRYEGSQEGSEIRYTGKVPAGLGATERIAAPKDPPPRGLHARTFGRLLARSGL